MEGGLLDHFKSDVPGAVVVVAWRHEVLGPALRQRHVGLGLLAAVFLQLYQVEIRTGRVVAFVHRDGLVHDEQYAIDIPVLGVLGNVNGGLVASGSSKHGEPRLHGVVVGVSVPAAIFRIGLFLCQVAAWECPLVAVARPERHADLVPAGGRLEVYRRVTVVLPPFSRAGDENAHSSALASHLFLSLYIAGWGRRHQRWVVFEHAARPSLCVAIGWARSLEGAALGICLVFLHAVVCGVLAASSAQTVFEVGRTVHLTIDICRQGRLLGNVIYHGVRDDKCVDDVHHTVPCQQVSLDDGSSLVAGSDGLARVDHGFTEQRRHTLSLGHGRVCVCVPDDVVEH
mmetsp:Transcript_26150/g.64972  ORF Transcript_26150/g.64972 Transcript_26150/m.64972 type:complete len:342 (-) Transcript_26150:419-1444(-)